MNILSDAQNGCLLLTVDSSAISAVKLDDRAEMDVTVSQVRVGRSDCAGLGL